MRAIAPLNKDLNETNRRMGSSEEEGGDRVCEQQTQKADGQGDRRAVGCDGQINQAYCLERRRF